MNINVKFDAIEIHLHTHGSEVKPMVAEVLRQTGLILANTVTLMSKETELQASIDELAATLVRVSTDIENQLKIINAPGTPDAAVDAAIARIGEINATLKQKATDLEADDPPPA